MGPIDAISNWWEGKDVLPATANPKYPQRRSKNSMVVAWFINSMEPTVGKPFLFLPTACDVWEAVKDTYSDLVNHSQLFELHTKMWRMQQVIKTLTLTTMIWWSYGRDWICFKKKGGRAQMIIIETSKRLKVARCSYFWQA